MDKKQTLSLMSLCEVLCNENSTQIRYKVGGTLAFLKLLDTHTHMHTHSLRAHPSIMCQYPVAESVTQEDA